MTAKARFNSVSEMVQDTFKDDPELVREVEAEIARRQLIKHLAIHRVRNNMSQQDVANEMGCTQSRISKMEAGDDDDLRLGDLRRYAKATGLAMQLVFSPRQLTIVDRVKLHANVIRKLLQELVDLGAGDQSITEGIVKFVCFEAPVHLLKMVVDAAKHLPPHMLNELSRRELPDFVIEDPPYTNECEECDAQSGEESNTTAARPT